MCDNSDDRTMWDRRGRGWAVAWTAISVLIISVVYGLVNQWAGMRGVTVWDPKQVFTLADGTFLDRHIPVVPWSVHVYNTLVLFYWLPACVMPANAASRQQLTLLMKTLVGVVCFACIFFVLFPAHVDMRDQVQAALAQAGTSSIDRYAFAAVHLLDTPYNSWPCLHIAQPILICGTISYWHWCKYPARIICLWIFCALLGASILTTKQHFIWDVITGTLLGAVALFWLLVRFRKIEKKPSS